MVDSVFRTRSLGVAAVGVPDQYSDGKAARVWEQYIGGKNERTSTYKQWLCSLLKERGCKTILDVACGTGVDSMVLVDEGFKVVSTDASDKMLKYALKYRWENRKDDKYDQWIIEEANWLTLQEDLDGLDIPKEGFDAVVCMGNSFAHLPDFDGTQSKQKLALQNFESLVKPGGLLLIDHRNYDSILDHGVVHHSKNVYYNSEFIDHITCSNLYVNGKPSMVTLDYFMEVPEMQNGGKEIMNGDANDQKSEWKFRLSYYPHRLEEFTDTLNEIFPKGSNHTIYGDFKPMKEAVNPAYFLHVVEKVK